MLISVSDMEWSWWQLEIKLGLENIVNFSYWDFSSKDLFKALLPAYML